MIKIYTDGSCIEHGARGGFGVVVYKDGKIIKLYNERHVDTTNNRMELSAILWALKNYGGPEEITICSDSQYCINTLSKWMFNWVANDWVKADGKTPENLDIIQDFYALRKQGYKVKFEWVKGHADDVGNIFADKLATQECLSECSNCKYLGDINEDFCCLKNKNYLTDFDRCMYEFKEEKKEELEF